MNANAERILLPDETPPLFPGAGVVMHLHPPGRPGPRNDIGVVVLPIQGGDYEISTLFAGYFAKIGFQALRFERRAEWLDASREPGDLQLLVKQFLADVRRGIDWWLTEADNGPARLGLFGVSMGANTGAVVAAGDSRIEASVLPLGGGDLADILMTAHDEEIDLYRKDLAARLGVDEPALRPMLEEALGPVDNLNFAHGMNADTTLFISARFDRVVRFANATRLWECIGRPKRIVLPCGHYSTIVFLPLVKLWARRWFDRLLVRAR